jgi:hypothetical protein
MLGKYAILVLFYVASVSIGGTTQPSTQPSSGSVLRADAPQNVKDFVKASAANRQKQIQTAQQYLSQLQEELRQAKRGSQSSGGRGEQNTPQSVDAINQKIAETRERIKGLRDGSIDTSVPLAGDDFKGSLPQGRIGKVAAVRSVNVVDPTHLLARIEYTSTRPKYVNGVYMKVAQPFTTNPMLLSDFDTTGIVDDQDVQIDKLFVVSGTSKVESSTTYQLKPFDLDSWMQK